MKFKIGDQVRLKHLTEEDIEKSQLTYFPGMVENEGKTGKILDVATNYYGYTVIEVEFKNETWWWLEDWLEQPISYNAF